MDKEENQIGELSEQLASLVQEVERLKSIVSGQEEKLLKLLSERAEPRGSEDWQRSPTSVGAMKGLLNDFLRKG